jgi:hypothetical protein
VTVYLKSGRKLYLQNPTCLNTVVRDEREMRQFAVDILSVYSVTCPCVLLFSQNNFGVLIELQLGLHGYLSTCLQIRKQHRELLNGYFRSSILGDIYLIKKISLKRNGEI